MEEDALTRIHVRPLNHLILEPVITERVHCSGGPFRVLLHTHGLLVNINSNERREAIK